MRTAAHWDNIQKLQVTNSDLTDQLKLVTDEKDDLQNQLDKKTGECEDLGMQFRQKCDELAAEQYALKLEQVAKQKLEEEVNDLKQVIAGLETDIAWLREKISDLEATNEKHEKQEESLQNQIDDLLAKIKNRKERWDIGIQVEPKMKRGTTQTEIIQEGNPGISSFGHVSDSGDMVTIGSTNMI